MEWFAASGRLAVGVCLLSWRAICRMVLAAGTIRGAAKGFTDSLSMTDRDVVRNRGVGFQ
jgi:hypothetical protein